MRVIVMPANVTSPEVRALMAAYPGLLGNLFSPGAIPNPTTENLLLWMRGFVIDHPKLARIRIYESSATWAELEIRRP